jgi:ubiquinone/menaquinone biosynthesis C-methylase UbiE
MALMADASQLPMPDQSVDVAVCTMVAHHLPEDVFEAVLRECQRVLRPDGCFVFLDWLRPTTRVPSRILCALDRGAHPYRLEHLQRLVEEHFEIPSYDRFAIFHEYVVMVLRPVSSLVGTVTSSYQTADK